jgi:hypothetical protein
MSELRKAGSFAKTHDLQVSVQSTLGQMGQEEQTIARRYGTTSPEMAQFKQQKQFTLGTVQSGIHAEYAKLNSSIDTSMAQLRAGTDTNMKMYENYNEQASLEVYKAAAQADQSFKLQWTEQLLGIEQLKMSNQNALATWVSETPVFSTSLSSFLATAFEMGVQAPQDGRQAPPPSNSKQKTA